MQPALGEHRTTTRSGLLLVDKPAGVSSHDVVAQARRAVASKRVGHAGTLDPFATGLLVLGVGNATRLLPYLDGEPKRYEAVIRFGYETNTDDATGIETVRAPCPNFAALPVAIRSLTGSLLQTPPAYSAKHVNGERAYAIARRGDAVTLAPVAVTVHEWRIVAQTENTLTVVITCKGGTYVRALARDLGRALGSAAHCASLRRVASGACHVQDAIPMSALVRGALADGVVALRSPLDALQEMAVVTLDAVSEAAVRNGRSVAATAPGNRAVLVNAFSEAIGIGFRTEDDRWQPRVVLPAETPDTGRAK